MKKIYLLIIALFIIQNLSAQSWPFLGSAGQGLNTQLGTNASDILAISDNEVYTAVFQLDAFANNKVLKIYKYDGNTWSDFSSIGEDGQTIGRIYLKKSKLGTLFIAYSKLGTQANYNIFIKKYQNGSFVSMGDSLGLTSGVSYFGFDVDNNDAPLVLGSKSSLLDPARVSKFENGTWSHTTIPNASGVTIDEKNTFVDDQNNLVFLFAKSQMVSGVFMTSVYVDTFANNAIVAGNDILNTKFMSTNYLLRDANNNISIFTREGGFGESYIRTHAFNNNTWITSDLDTIPLNSINGVAMSASGKILLSNSDGKIYVSPSFNTPISNPDASTYCLRLTCTGEKGYAIYNTGVVSGDINSVVGVKSNTLVDLNVYPNPAKDIIYIRSTTKITSVKIYSLEGQLVANELYQNGVSIADLKSGMYLIEAELENTEIARTKIIKY